VDDGTGEGAGDPLDPLDAGDDELAELVHALGLGADDHVVGARDVLGVGDSLDLTDLGRDRAFPTSVWMRMYALTTMAPPGSSTRPS
jgi:hypothetical protein